MSVPIAPDPLYLPKFALFCDARRLTCREVAQALGCSHETVRRMQLEFGNVRRCIPKPPLMNRVVVWTGGEVQPSHFYPSPEVVRLMAGSAAA